MPRGDLRGGNTFRVFRSFFKPRPLPRGREAKLAEEVFTVFPREAEGTHVGHAEPGDDLDAFGAEVGALVAGDRLQERTSRLIFAMASGGRLRHVAAVLLNSRPA